MPSTSSPQDPRPRRRARFGENAALEIDAAEVDAELPAPDPRPSPADVPGGHGHSRPLRDRAIFGLVVRTGVPRGRVVDLDLSQLSPATPSGLRRAREPRLTLAMGKGGVTTTVVVDAATQAAIADYLEAERPDDADLDSTGLFLSARSIASRRAGGRLSLRSINTAVNRGGADPAEAGGGRAPARPGTESRRTRADVAGGAPGFPGGVEAGRVQRLHLYTSPAQPSERPVPPRSRPDRRPPAHNLPGHASSFVGRRAEIDATGAAVAQHRLVTLAGAGGIGKTRLALEVADRAVPGFPDGVWMVELAAVLDGGLVAEAVAAALPEVGRSRRDADLVDQLRDRRMLLVLDNCEHLVSGCAALVASLLRSCPGLSVLATSREPLGVAGELVRWMLPLQLPGPDDLDTASVAATDAVRLFQERATAADAGFAMGAGVAPAVAEICRRLDGLPLAIELAAARMAIMSPSEIVERLDDRFHFLAGRRSTADPRHQTLRATLEWSHDLLDESEAVVLRRLSVFAGGWGLRSAEEVCAGGGIAADVLDLLEALVAKSLVVVDRDAAVTRYRMLESIRCFALEKLDASEEAEDIRLAHAGWCVARAERAERERRGRRQAAWLMALEEDHDNFRAALTWARDRQRVDMVLALGGALSWFWQTRGHLREGLEWLRWAVARDPDNGSDVRARALRGAGMLTWLVGDVGSALPLVEESVVLFGKAGNQAEAGGCVCSSAFHLCANPAHSVPVLQDNVERIRAREDYNRLAHALVNCGLAHFFTGDAAAARVCFDECLALPFGALDPEVVGHALLGVGRAAILTGDLQGAEVPFREALDLAVSTGDVDSRSTVLSLLGDLYRARGDYPRARSLLGDALELVDDGGPPLSVARAQQFLARVEAAEGNFESARSLFSASLSGAEALPYHRVRSVLGLGQAAASLGRASEARALFEDAKELATDTGDAQGVARALCGLAGLARAAGDVDATGKLAAQALEIQEGMGDRLGLTETLEVVAELCLVAGRLPMAVRLLAASQAARQDRGFPRPPAAEAAHVDTVEAARAGLGPDEFEQTWAEGWALPLAQAVAYAVRGRGRKGRPSKGWESLSPTEHEIARLAADGLMNAEIGERLFISPRTVSTHLHHIYGKVGVGSRRELATQVKDRARGPAAPPVARPVLPVLASEEDLIFDES